MDGAIFLVRQSFSEDELRQQEAVEEEREILCELRSVTRQEWRDAGQNHIRASLVAVTPAANYEGEQLAVVEGKRMAVYRTYHPPDSDLVELYLKEEAGEL